MKNIAAFFVTVLVCGPLAAAIFGGEPYETFDQGGVSYIVLGNSLIDDQMTLFGEGVNKQGDTCLASSSDTLTMSSIPVDAVVAKAYLIWTGAVDPAKLTEPTDNMVHLKFAREDGYIYETDIVAGDSAKMLGDTTDPFLFESVQMTAEVPTGCSETEAGTVTTADLAYFTYRVEVTDFFTKILDDNHASENPVMDGQALFGDYTTSGLDCTEDDVYRCPTLMVSNWSLVIIYQSGEIMPKTLYLYPGFSFKKDETADVTLGGLDLPYLPSMHMMMLSSEGDPALLDAHSGFELVTMRDEAEQTFVLLAGDCDPQDDIYNEVWDSRRSGFMFNAEGNKYCTGYDTEFTYGFDIDQWYLDATADEHLANFLPDGTTEMTMHFNFAFDEVLTNLLILSVDKKYANFDIPGDATDWPEGREKTLCSCVKDPEDHNGVCQDRPYYYLIKVQNWGDDTAHDVMVIDNPEACGMIFYVPGSTEMATQFDQDGNGTDWTPIPDGPDGECPLKGDGFKVADTMAPCDINTMTCPDTRLIRFKVQPNNAPKNCVIDNIAYIKEAASEIQYATNTNFKLTSGFRECKPIEECPEPPKSECGGPEEEPVTDSDTITNVDEDIVITDEPATDDTTVPDTDTKKDGGGCALVVF